MSAETQSPDARGQTPEAAAVPGAEAAEAASSGGRTQYLEEEARRA
jgi:hypothetical protein